MKGRNDNSTIVQEVMLRDPETMKIYRVEIETSTLYTSRIWIRFFDGVDPVGTVRASMIDGKLEVDTQNE